MTDRMSGCGITNHNTDCLCDVVVANVSAINFDPTTFWGVEFAERAGYSWEDGPEKMLELLEALAKAKDIAANMKTFDNVDRRGVARASDSLRKSLGEWIASGQSIIDAPHEFKESWGNILAAMTSGRANELWAWREAQWAEFEDWVDIQGELRYRAIMGRFDVSRSVAVLLERFYRCDSRRERADTAAAIREVLISHPSQKNAWLCSKVARETGVEVTPEEVTQIRSRLRHQNLVPRSSETLQAFRQRMTPS